MIVKTVHRFFYLPFNHDQKQKHFPWVDTHTARMRLRMQFPIRVSTVKGSSTHTFLVYGYNILQLSIF